MFPELHEQKYTSNTLAGCYIAKHVLSLNPKPLRHIMGYELNTFILKATLFIMFHFHKYLFLFREPTNIVVVADVDLSEEHNEVMDKFFKYLKEYGGVEKVFYVKDPDDGLDPSENIQTWWQKALRDPKVVKDGCLIVVAGPTTQEVNLCRRVKLDFILGVIY